MCVYVCACREGAWLCSSCSFCVCANAGMHVCNLPTGNTSIRSSLAACASCNVLVSTFDLPSVMTTMNREASSGPRPRSAIM